MSRFLGYLLLLVTLAAMPAHAQEYRVGDLIISQPWARASVGTTRPTAVYLTIRNDGSQSDALVGASTPVAGQVELHQSQMEGDVMKMTPVPELAIGAGQTVALAPGGYHLMLIALRQALGEGSQFPMTVKFKSGRAIEVRVAVRPIGASGNPETPAMPHHHH